MSAVVPFLDVPQPAFLAGWLPEFRAEPPQQAGAHAGAMPPFLRQSYLEADAGDMPLCLSSAQAAELASRAAVLEAAVSPKPGLVCIDGNGAHSDMSYPLFVRSAHALQSYFGRAHALGEATRGMAPEHVFVALRGLGVEAEARMLAATGGVNTHKGLIFSLGLFCAAVGRLAGRRADVAAICRVASSFTQGLTKQDFAPLEQHRAALIQDGHAPDCARPDRVCPDGIGLDNISTDGIWRGGAGIDAANPKAARPVLEKRLGRRLSAGEVMYLLYGITGIRGEAESGFPHVELACKTLAAHGAERGLNTAMAHCLLELMCSMTDTTLLWRGGPQGLAHARRFAKAALKAGGLRTAVGRATVQRMSADFARRRLSPGGCADVLAVGVFLFLLRRQSC